MSNDLRKHVFLVDDEPDTRQIVSQILGDLGLRISCFPSGQNCLKQLRAEACDLLITDLKMLDMDGMELLRKAKRMLPLLPVLVMTGYGDVPTAVECLHMGASEFIEKPVEIGHLRSTVTSLLARECRPKLAQAQPLTKTESKILAMILDGKGNKKIAHAMSRSMRTIEDHRSHIMKKLGVDNMIDLVKRFSVVNLPDLSQDND